MNRKLNSKFEFSHHKTESILVLNPQILLEKLGQL